MSNWHSAHVMYEVTVEVADVVTDEAAVEVADVVTVEAAVEVAVDVADVVTVDVADVVGVVAHATVPFGQFVLGSPSAIASR